MHDHRKVERFLVLYTLSDDLDPKLLGQFNRRLQLNRVILVDVGVLTKYPIYLELWTRKLAEIAKRRLSKAVIVHGNRYASAAIGR